MDKSILILNTPGSMAQDGCQHCSKRETEANLTGTGEYMAGSMFIPQKYYGGGSSRSGWRPLGLFPEKLGIDDVSEIQGIIRQLKSLEEHCQDMVDKNDPECIWKADCHAVGVAIKTLESIKEYRQLKNEADCR